MENDIGVTYSQGDNSLSLVASIELLVIELMVIGLLG